MKAPIGIKKVLIITALLSGILLAVQIRSFKNVEFLIQRSQPANVVTALRSFQIANATLRDQLSEEEATLEALRSKVASVAVGEQIAQLKLQAGEEAVKGEGVEVIINAPVQAFWITDLITEVVSIGAEAVAVNDIRLTARTAGFRDVGGGMVMRRTFLKPPYRISIIGPRKKLHDTIAQNGGIIDRIEKGFPGLHSIITEKETIIIPALN